MRVFSSEEVEYMMFELTGLYSVVKARHTLVTVVPHMGIMAS